MSHSVLNKTGDKLFFEWYWFEDCLCVLLSHKNKLDHGCLHKYDLRENDNNCNLRILQDYNGSYKCSDCGLTLRHKSSFNRHRRQHQGIFPYHCNFCGKGFTVKVNMLGHQVSQHQQGGRHVCPVCQKDYSYAYLLKKHVQEKHPEYEGNVDG